MSFVNKEANSILRCANGNNNNNNLTKLAAANNKTKTDDDQKIWDCRCAVAAAAAVGCGGLSGSKANAAVAAGFVEDKGGGITALKIDIEETDKNAENGATACCDTFENHYALYDDDAGAYDSDEAAAAAAVLDFHSNRNSRNNSTDNLSFASDQFYAKDLIFLEDDYDDDDDGGAEVEDDISLNSDDCVYAYRGEGADFDFPFEALSGRQAGIAGNSVDDEMDFLEMDFDPDTLSEIENGGHSIGSGAALSAADALLLQRDISQARHADVLLQQQQHQQRQLFSSPIDGLNITSSCTAASAVAAAAPMKVLSSQTLLGKNFGRMSLHLDQIKGIGSDCENSITKPLGCETNFERLNGSSAVNVAGVDNCSAISSSVGANQKTDLVIDYPSSAAHSLPNTLHAFGRASNEVVSSMSSSSSAKKASPTKVTGAKPKRLSTFSTSSSTSSKNSCKSRTSLRSVIGSASLYNSTSFDERSVSCTEFRSAPPPLTIAGDTSALANSANVLATTTAAATVANQFDANEDSTCLDCLEKEFLASTIGKAIDEKPFNCSKCRRKRYNLNKLEFQQQQQQQQQLQHQKPHLKQSLRCRSGSPSAFFTEIVGDSFYEFPHENWLSGGGGGVGQRAGGLSSFALLSTNRRSQDLVLPCMTSMLPAAASSFSSSATAFKCDIIGNEKLRKNLTTEKETISISMADINEENLISALEKLQIAFNAESIKLYFENLRRQQQQVSSTESSSSSNATKSKEFKDLKHFLLYESKKNCNHPKMKRLIEYAAPHQVDVQFKKDFNKSEPAMVKVSATDILRHWSRNNNLLCLQKLDDRFKSANVLGKITNLIRQANQTKRPASKRTQIEFIAIPQYYPDGFLIFKKMTQNV